MSLPGVIANPFKPILLLLSLAAVCVSALAAYDKPVYTVSVTRGMKYGEGERKSQPNLDLLLALIEQEGIRLIHFGNL